MVEAWMLFMLEQHRINVYVVSVMDITVDAPTVPQ
jgi:hypothetical protein